jgi:hypothetical protein
LLKLRHSTYDSNGGMLCFLVNAAFSISIINCQYYISLVVCFILIPISMHTITLLHFLRQKALPLLSTLVFVSMFVSSCQPVFKMAVGIKPTKHLSEKQIAAKHEKFGIDKDFSYYVDTNYVRYLSLHFDEKNAAEKPLIKDYLQPLQAAYFLKKQTADILIINCDAEMTGFNLTLNKHGEMDVFPPKYNTKGSEKILLNEYLPYLKPISAAKQTSNLEIDNYNNVILIQWSSFMGRQAKIFIRQVLNNLKLSNVNTLVLFVNTDNVYAK